MPSGGAGGPEQPGPCSASNSSKRRRTSTGFMEPIPTSAARSTSSILSFSWVGLRCRVSVEPASEGLLADLRRKPNVPDSSITEPKALDADGKAALLVADESLEGTTVSLVILDTSGRVVCKKPQPLEVINSVATRPSGPTRSIGVRRLPRPQGPRPAVQ
jgi:hypothetical protein